MKRKTTLDRGDRSKLSFSCPIGDERYTDGSGQYVKETKRTSIRSEAVMTVYFAQTSHSQTSNSQTSNSQTSNCQTSSSSYQQLQKVFQTVDAQSCPFTFNFHMHTVYSDGRLQPEELIEQAISIGLRGLAITDHHTIGGYRAAQRHLAQWQIHHPDLADRVPQLWSGVEINAGLLNAEVHILAYAFDPQHPRLQPYLQRRAATGEEYRAANVISAIHQAGGIAVLAHPSRYKRSHFDLIPAASEIGIDGVETYYAYNNPNPWQPSQKETQQVSQLSQTYRLLNTCGTDTHGRSILQRL